GHAARLVAPGAEVDLAGPVAADVRLSVDQPAEGPGVDLLPDPAKLALAAPLVADREHHARLAAGLGKGTRVGDRIGDRLVEKHVLAGACRGGGGFEMRIVGRRIDYSFDAFVFQNRIKGRRRAATVFRRKRIALFFGSRVAGHDFQPARALDRVRKHVGPPPHPDTGDPHVCLLLPARADRLHRLARDALVEFEIAAAHADAADAFALDDHRATA